eukprot:m.1241530 g.1241530  ORF g.1241530 m.1241530 type:complete len:487 (+) comp24680_c0_seq1:354-1814(+)
MFLLPRVFKLSLVVSVACCSSSRLECGYGETFLTGTYPAFGAPKVPAEFSLSCSVLDPSWGAKGDGVTDDTKSIQRAINECCGRCESQTLFEVVLPAKKLFLSGALNLSSRMTLRVDGGLLGSTDPNLYPVIPALEGYGTCRDTGYPTAHAYGRHQALLSGWNLSDTFITGTGFIDGQGLVPNPRLGNSSWASRMRDNALDFGRPRLWEPMYSRNVAVVGVGIRNQAFWGLHPYACNGVYVADVNVTAPRDEGIPNDDGIDPDSTANVLVERCFVSVGDNSVAIKSGMDRAGRAFGQPSCNHVYRHSTFASETFAIGSEMSGGVFNITVNNCSFGGSESDFAGVHLKSTRGRGGAIHDIVVSQSTFHCETSHNMPMPISASLYYGGAHPPPTNASATPHMHAVSFVDVVVHLPVPHPRIRERTVPHPRTQGVSFQFIGLAESLLSDFRFDNVSILGSANNGWQCSYTDGFVFTAVTPMPSQSSGCL